ncbi:MAG: class I SAM-dependent methyltransferase [Pyrinomonadaceae bacterium]
MNPKNLKKLISQRREQVFGRCNICGKTTLFYTKEAGHVRESLFCLRCKSVSRKRHVAKIILETFAPQFRSLKGARETLSKLSIYSAVSNDALHRFLGEGNRNFVCSELFPDTEEGMEKNGVLCQNLERLTFDDEKFDLVITEDVFEHVRRPMQGFREVHRVLKAGGYHIFTVPFNFDKPTVQRIDTATEKDVYLLPPEYHGDTLRDRILVYTDFGYDIVERLNALGFETSLSLSTHSDAVRYGIADSYVFISRKTYANQEIS